MYIDIGGLQLNKKIKIVISVVIVLIVASMTWYLSYPEEKESVEVGFADAWPVEAADANIKIQDELKEGIPVVKFKYNNRNYTTAVGEEGLTVEPRKEAFEDILEYIESGNTSQIHATMIGGKIYAVYVLIDNGQVYFSTEELINVDSSNYLVTLEKKDENRTIVHFKQGMALTLMLTVLITIITSFIVLASWVKPPSSKKEM